MECGRSALNVAGYGCGKPFWSTALPYEADIEQYARPLREAEAEVQQGQNSIEVWEDLHQYSSNIKPLCIFTSAQGDQFNLENYQVSFLNHLTNNEI